MLTPLEWFKKRLSDPQILMLVLIIVGGLGVLYLFGSAFKPVFAAVIIAYLLDGFVTALERRHCPRGLAVGVVFGLFLFVAAFLFVSLVPLLSEQIQQLASELPRIVTKVQVYLQDLPEDYPSFITRYIESFVDSLGSRFERLGGTLLSLSISYIPGLVTLLIYVVLVPFLILFMLKDKFRILAWIRSVLPPYWGLVDQIWEDVNRQIGNFVRGKIWEIIIIGVVTYLTFRLLGFNYSALLGVLTGLSVLIPYIGAAVVTIPVAALGFFQWGPSSELVYLLVAYGIIQALDGNVLVPLIFSEAVKIHPVAIIVAILTFGSIWGFWGVFFAIPLATLVQSILHAFPRLHSEVEEGTDLVTATESEGRGGEESEGAVDSDRDVVHSSQQP